MQVFIISLAHILFHLPENLEKEGINYEQALIKLLIENIQSFKAGGISQADFDVINQVRNGNYSFDEKIKILNKQIKNRKSCEELIFKGFC